jgi:hypothetical protein
VYNFVNSPVPSKIPGSREVISQKKVTFRPLQADETACNISQSERNGLRCGQLFYSQTASPVMSLFLIFGLISFPYGKYSLMWLQWCLCMCVPFNFWTNCSPFTKFHINFTQLQAASSNSCPYFFVSYNRYVTTTWWIRKFMRWGDTIATKYWALKWWMVVQLLLRQICRM